MSGAGPDPLTDARGATLSEIAERLRQQEPPATRLDPEANLRLRDLQQDIELKKTYARAALIGLAIQLLIADGAFGYYMVSYSGKVPTAAIETWLGAIVIQVVGVVLVITRYLFPDRSGTGRGPAAGNP